MKIKIIFNSSYPIGKVSTHRVHHIAKGLIENGADVVIVLVHPTENLNKIENDTPSGVFEGVKYRYINNILFRKKNLLLRKMIDFYCHLSVIFEVLFNKNNPDINIVIGPSLDFRTFLPIVNFFNKSKIYLEINEYPFLKNSESLLPKLKRNTWFKTIVPMYDGFIVISKELENLMNKYISKNASNIRIPILGDFKQINEVSQSNLIDSKYIIHSGSLFEDKDGILGILKAFKVVIEKYDRPLKLVITGNSKIDSNNKEVFNYINENKLSNNIIFTGFISINELNSYMQNASLTVINKYDNLQNRYCFSTKLADYLANRVPIIITDVGEAKEYLKDNENSYIIEEQNLESLVDKILFSLSNVSQNEKQSLKGLELINKDFNYKFQGKKLLDFFKDNFK